MAASLKSIVAERSVHRHRRTSASPVVMVVHEPGPRREQVLRALTELGYSTAEAAPGEAAVTAVRHGPEIVIVVSSETASCAAIDCLRQLHSTVPSSRHIFLTATSSEELAIAALQAGAQRYLKEPYTIEALNEAVRALLPSNEARGLLPDGLNGGECMVGRSRAVSRLRTQIARVAPTGSSVLVQGETGTGKEMVAELIHLNSRRASKPFVCLNTAAIPDALVESELFGHERGAFTGATVSRAGKLVAANGGTVFFDEIGDVSLPIQAKLLRALENKEAHRLGDTRSVPIDVRVVAATNHNLERAVAEGRFRQDLYYRLNVVRIETPPLRDRSDDIALLITHYLRLLNRELGRSVHRLSPRAMETLCAYHWPGNVRELRNAIEALLVNLDPETTGTVDVPPEVMRQLSIAAGSPTSERDKLLHALTTTNWNKSKAASQLHISRMTLYRKMQRHNVTQPA